MPRSSKRAKVLKALKTIQSTRRQNATLRELFNVENDEDSLDDEDWIEDNYDSLVDAAVDEVEARRYLFRSKTYRDRNETFVWQDIISDNSVRFSESEFHVHFRMNRNSYHILLSLLEHKETFYTVSKGRKQLPIPLQLLIFLRRIGSEGTEASYTKLAVFFGIGAGTVSVVVRRVQNAFLEHYDELVSWPSLEGKNLMKEQIKVEYGFQNCIGIIDGTIIILDEKPLKYGESYYCRKNCYSLNVQVVCNHECKIQYLYGGWPGSTHDNRAWRNCKLYTKRDEYFDDGEYLLSDSAYLTCRCIVQSFKNIPGQLRLSPAKEFFNSKLGSLRVKSEHCIGILKNRFPALRRTNIQIKGKRSIKKVMDMFRCCAILHNILLDCNEHIPDEWLETLSAEEYWIEEYDVSDESIREENFDMREGVFDAILHFFEFGGA